MKIPAVLFVKSRAETLTRKSKQCARANLFKVQSENLSRPSFFSDNRFFGFNLFGFILL